MDHFRANAKDNSRRKFRGGGPRPDRRQLRQDEARERQEAWAKLSPLEQLKSLDARLGKGAGAVKQRARIHKQMETVHNTIRAVKQGKAKTGS